MKYLSTQQVAEMVGITEAQVITLIRNRRLPALNVSAGRRPRFRINEADVRSLEFVDLSSKPKPRRRRSKGSETIIEFV